jgi:uncharacterized protein YcbK (DUF882 family)
MGDLSKNLSRSEFACKCGCGHDTVDVALVRAIQDSADYFNARVFINSGTRCPEHNTAEGGSPGSQHILGRAADYRLEDVSATALADYLEFMYPYKYGIGRYTGRTHLDTRGRKARWDKRNGN